MPTLNEFLEKALTTEEIGSQEQELINEFVDWASKKNKVKCIVIDNNKDICELTGKLTISKERNQSGYPRSFTISGSGVKLDSSYWYINGLYKSNKKGFMVVVDGYHNYMLI